MVLTNGGGAGVLAADRLADWGGVLALLSDATRAALDAVLPPTWSKANPVDIIGDATADRYVRSLDILLQDANADAFLVMNCPTALADATEAARGTIDTIGKYRLGRRGKPVLTVWLGDGAAEPARALFRASGLPTFETPDDAIGGYMQLVRYRRAQTELMQTPPSLPVEVSADPDTAKTVFASALSTGRTILTEVEAKRVLAAYGIPTVPTRVAATPEEAGQLVAELLAGGGTAVIKILSRDISHKSDVGGVKLDIETAQQAVEAARAIARRVEAARPGAVIDGFAVQQMIKRPRAHELIAGMSVDATFGPLITFGAGGTAVEVLRDTAQALPPLDLRLAMDLMRQTRTFKLLSGYRDRPAADLDAVALTLVRLSYLISQNPEIRELDINPLLADEKGVIALDARVVLADPAREARTPMAIRPYPSAWERTIELAGGRRVLVRPIRPEDEARYVEFLKSVEPRDIRLRFFTVRREFSHAFVARFTQIDYAREMAFIAIEPHTSDILGIVRLVADPDYRRGEFGVLVRSSLKGQGLGWQLMQHLIAYGRGEGLEEIHGDVLAENTTMLKMCAELGFGVETDPEDGSVRHVRLRLSPAAAPTPACG
jgi:acetyltransferase